jgi:predicted adenylyl cyclase CyaB
MRNLEYKAPVHDLPAFRAKALSLGADLWGDLRQTDTYFAVLRGRLKIRESAGFQAELIFYERDESAATRPSDYQIASAPDGQALKSLLTSALGVLAVVRKRRTLLLLDTARIHLDNVEGLGSFVEIEVPVTAPEDEPAAAQRLESLIRDLGLEADGGIRESYVEFVDTKELK